MYERKNRNREGGIPPLDPEIPKAILKQGNTVTARVTSRGKSKKLTPHERENRGNRMV